MLFLFMHVGVFSDFVIAPCSDDWRHFPEIREGADRYGHVIWFEQNGQELVARRTFSHFHADFHVIRVAPQGRKAVFEVWVEFYRNHCIKQSVLSVSMGQLRAADVNSIFMFLDTQTFYGYREMVAALRKKTI